MFNLFYNICVNEILIENDDTLQDDQQPDRMISHRLDKVFCEQNGARQKPPYESPGCNT